MNLSRFINPSCLFFNKFHPSSAVYSALTVKKLGIKLSVSFSSFYNCKESFDTSKLALTPFSPLVFNSRGLKIKGQLQLRCKNCYFVRKDGVMHVACSTYPRHEQRAQTKRLKYTWILTHAFQSKRRPY